MKNKRSFIISILLTALLLLILTGCDLGTGTTHIDRMVKMSYYSESDILQSYRVYEYDSNNNKTKRSYFNESDVLQSYIVYEYDSNNNETKKSYYAGSYVLQDYYVYEYDSNNNQTKRSYLYPSPEPHLI